MIKIRELLGCLPSPSLSRLCEGRGLEARSREAKLEALARSYRGDHAAFADELQKADLVQLLASPMQFSEGEFYLPSASRYPVDDLRRIAVRAFIEDKVPREFVPCNDENDDDDDDDDDEEHERACGSRSGLDYRSQGYAKIFADRLRFSPRAASMRPHRYQQEAAERILRSISPARPTLLHLATGGGKTLVANNVLVEWSRRHEGPVLWITKDWRLLAQAAFDLAQRYEHRRPCRMGGDGGPLHPMQEGDRRDVIYTTIQTLVRRIDDGVLAELRPTLIVWDESHWGEESTSGRRIRKNAQRNDIPLLGLTATPRRDTRYETAYSKSFRELVAMEVLAEQRLEHPVRTGIPWTPTFHHRHGDASAASLRELANCRRRNEKIVEHYVRNSPKYDRTIVFACTTSHADTLARMLVAQGIAARAIHSGMDKADSNEALEAFKAREASVLVNVEMLTHGVDVPDANTVFLCRPTTSDILFAQMVGRAARRDREGRKTHFYVVEFSDVIEQHEDLFKTAKKLFDGSAGSVSHERPVAAAPRVDVSPRPQHAFDPIGAPTWVANDPTHPEAIRGLWYRHGQTFGIEFELTSSDGAVPQLGDEWIAKAQALRATLASALPGRVSPHIYEGYEGGEGRKDTSVWNIEYDVSAGWEVTSPILANRPGFSEVVEACRALEIASERLNLRVSPRTGTHVHLGWLGRDVAEVKRAIRYARLFEPALASLVAPSRIVHLGDDGAYQLNTPNSYCGPVSSVFSDAVLARCNRLDDVAHVASADSARYVTFNVRPLSHLHTVEVRMHSGTIDARKVLLWVSLWQQILWAAAHRGDPPLVPDRTVIQPGADIIALATEFLPDARQAQQQVLLERLAARRAEVVERRWKTTPALASWVEASSRWADVPSDLRTV